MYVRVSVVCVCVGGGRLVVDCDAVYAEACNVCLFVLRDRIWSSNTLILEYAFLIQPSIQHTLSYTTINTNTRVCVLAPLFLFCYILYTALHSPLCTERWKWVGPGPYQRRAWPLPWQLCRDRVSATAPLGGGVCGWVNVWMDETYKSHTARVILEISGY